MPAPLLMDPRFRGDDRKRGGNDSGVDLDNNDMIALIDYGMGNIRSVEKALEVVGGKVRIVSSSAGIAGCNKLVLPGVGAFGDAVKELKKLRLVGPIKDAIKEGKLFLGLCLGLQLLFEKSDEAPGVKGLGILQGDVKRFSFSQYTIRNTQYTFKVPHMGWNTIACPESCGPKRSEILRGIPDSSYVYFVHSYYVKPQDKKVILTATEYGLEFASGIAKDNIYGFQFHPEKSQDLGLKILRNFVNMKAKD